MSTVALVLLAALVAVWRVRALHERARRVAHEVRGPLTAAGLVVHGAGRRGELTPAVAAQLERELRRAALALEDPHGGGAGASAGRSGAPVDVGALLRSQAPTWRELAAVRGARLVVADAPVPLPVRADGLRLEQATTNVVANAIEHGKGEVEVEARVVEGRVRVEIRDGGPGLPRPSLATFARRLRRRRQGRGRGLAIASRVLAGYGGRLSPARGHVAIDLPIADAEA
jgi:signal transduction histidine kinase